MILSHHSRFTCECNKEDIKDDDDAQEHGEAEADQPGGAAAAAKLLGAMAALYLKAVN